MSKAPLFVIMKRLERIPLRLQVEHLQAIRDAEPPHSRRSKELYELHAYRKARLILKEKRA